MINTTVAHSSDLDERTLVCELTHRIVATPQVRKFLGFSFTGGANLKRRLAPQTVGRFKAKVRELTRRTRGRSLA